MTRNKNDFQGNKKREGNKGRKPDFKKKQNPKRANKPHEITDIDNDAVLPEDENFVFGHHASLEALKAGRGNKLFIQEDAKGKYVDALKEAAQEQAVPVKWVPKSKLDLLSDNGVHQGVIVATTPYEYLTLDGLFEKTGDKENPFYLLLDQIEDPHNFGSILRTADAAGVDGVIIPKHRAVGITPVVVKTSTGAVEHVPIARVTNLSQAVATLKEQGFWIFGTDMNGTNYTKWNTAGKIGLIIGNEGRGMGANLKKEVDELLTIPMVGHVQSLNASVATGLLIYEVFRNRQ
jgi:23S rRNA (guanosine2251-2'-O)-methyltransferase